MTFGLTSLLGALFSLILNLGFFVHPIHMACHEQHRCAVCFWVGADLGFKALRIARLPPSPEYVSILDNRSDNDTFPTVENIVNFQSWDFIQNRMVVGPRGQEAFSGGWQSNAIRWSSGHSIRVYSPRWPCGDSVPRHDKFLNVGGRTTTVLKLYPYVNSGPVVGDIFINFIHDFESHVGSDLGLAYLPSHIDGSHSGFSRVLAGVERLPDEKDTEAGHTYRGDRYPKKPLSIKRHAFLSGQVVFGILIFAGSLYLFLRAYGQFGPIKTNTGAFYVFIGINGMLAGGALCLLALEAFN